MKKLCYFILLLTVFNLVFLPEGNQPAAAESNSEIDINVKPDEYLFNVPNMKPGDWVPRTIKIQNNSANAFKYETILQKNGGSEKLFHELLLEVSHKNNELYNGKLAEFNGFSSRSLEPSSEEVLKFTIKIPEHLGNEYQGLETSFVLTFQAQSDAGTDQAISAGTIGNGSSALPNTATNIFTYFIIGVALAATGGIIYFLHLIRQNNHNNLADLDL